MKSLGEFLCRMFHGRHRSMENWSGFYCNLCCRKRIAPWGVVREVGR